MRHRSGPPSGKLTLRPSGIIFGTGCNAAYMEKISAITKLKGLDGMPADAEVRFPDHAGCSKLMLCLHRWRSTVNGTPLNPSFVDGGADARTLSRGAFDSTTHEHLPRTSYDITIDETSNKPGEQAFEKMIAGLYLGEIFRLVMCEMVRRLSLPLRKTSAVG